MTPPTLRTTSPVQVRSLKLKKQGCSLMHLWAMAMTFKIIQKQMLAKYYDLLVLN